MKQIPSLFEMDFNTDPNLIRYYLELGVNPDALDEETGASILHWLVDAPYPRNDMIEVLLNEGEASVDIRSRKGETPLHWAVKMNLKPTTLEILVDYKADLNAADALGNTPLHYSVQNEHFVITKFLLDKGARTDIRNKTGLFPYDIAVKYGILENKEIFKALVKGKTRMGVWR